MTESWKVIRLSSWASVLLLAIGAFIFVESTVPQVMVGRAGLGYGHRSVWFFILLAVFVAGALAGATMVNLALLPQPGAPQPAAERVRIMSASSGTAKAAAGLAAGLITAGFKPDATLPPATALGVLIGVLALLLVAAESSYAVRELPGE